MDDVEQLDWIHKTTSIRERRAVLQRANEKECALVSRVFGDAVCKSLTSKYDVIPLAPGRYRVVGHVEARVEQICGVTLDPIEQKIDEMFDVEFRADARGETDLEPDFDALADDEPEPIKHGEIEIGRFLCEIVGSAIDPFPRAEDATLEHVEANESEKSPNPFAVLEQLKNDPSSR